MKKWQGDVVFVLVVGALIGGWFYLYPRPEASPLQPLEPPAEAAAWKRAEPPELVTYASPEGLELAYRLYEPGGPVRHVLVFLHDTLLHGGWYVDLGQTLAREGVAVFLPDRRSWGRSAGEHKQVTADPTILIEDLTAMIQVAQSRYPQARIVIGGHGRGAGLALRYAASGRPVAGLVLVEPYLWPGQPNLRPEEWQVLMRAHPGEALLAQWGLIDWRVWHVNWPASMLKADPLLETDLSLAQMQETVPEDPIAALQALPVPVLWIQGQADPLFAEEETGPLVALVPTAPQWEMVPEAGYLTVLEATPGLVADWIN